MTVRVWIVLVRPVVLTLQRLASWDSPPRSNDDGYAAYERAFARFIYGRSVIVPTRGKKEPLPKDGFRWTQREAFTVDNQPMLGQSPQLKLMPFQVEGVNWLVHNWHKDQNCILADEMGLVRICDLAVLTASPLTPSSDREKLSRL